MKALPILKLPSFVDAQMRAELRAAVPQRSDQAVMNPVCPADDDRSRQTNVGKAAILLNPRILLNG